MVSGIREANLVASSGVPVVPLAKVGAVVAFASTGAAATKLALVIVSQHAWIQSGVSATFLRRASSMEPFQRFEPLEPQ